MASLAARGRWGASVTVHVDFKGLPPTPAHLCGLFRALAALGVAGVLLEWEDMLPFSGELACLRAPHAYTDDEVAQVIGCAFGLGLEVIPLVQTLGHLEFVLKHESFAHLREDQTDFGTLCPCHPETPELLQEMLQQVLSWHPQATALHIGCDEPTLGTNEHTWAVMATPRDEDNTALGSVLIDHVHTVQAIAESLMGSQLREILLWHDAVANMPSKCLASLRRPGATSTTSIVVWDYRSDPELSRASMQFFSSHLASTGTAALIATAFKGADACDAIVPRIEERIANQRAWKVWYEEQAAQGGSSGGARVIITGWSRFGHLMPLTESLCAGQLSLFACIGVWAQRTGAFPYNPYCAHLKCR